MFCVSYVLCFPRVCVVVEPLGLVCCVVCCSVILSVVCGFPKRLFGFGVLGPSWLWKL